MKLTHYNKQLRIKKAITEARKKVAARSVIFTRNPEDFDVALMGSLGFSTKAIMNKTGLSFSQVIYRLNKGKIRRVDYRNGETTLSQFILKKNAELAKNELYPQLKKIDGVNRNKKTK